MSYYYIPGKSSPNKGELLDFWLYSTKNDAQRAATGIRKHGRSARVFSRSIKVDGFEIIVHVLVVREKKGRVAP